jgi:predicted GNAT family N-acyltransferase
VGKLRQMATAKHVRGKGYGVALVQALEKHATEIGIEKIVLHSRHYAVGFYEKLGYQVTSDVFQEVGINHFMMNKQL